MWNSACLVWIWICQLSGGGNCPIFPPAAECWILQTSLNLEIHGESERGWSPDHEQRADKMRQAITIHTDSYYLGARERCWVKCKWRDLKHSSWYSSNIVLMMSFTFILKSWGISGYLYHTLWLTHAHSRLYWRMREHVCPCGGYLICYQHNIPCIKVMWGITV